MVDTAAAAPPPKLKLTRRRRPSSAALSSSNANAGAGDDDAPTKPKAKAKTVASRYLAPFSSKPSTISSSANASSVAATTTNSRRSVSSPVAARRVVVTNAVTASADAVASSGSGAAATRRTLSVAFQTPTYCLDTSKATRSVSPAASAATFSPEKRRSGTAVTPVQLKLSEGGQNTRRWPASAPSGRDAVVTKLPDYLRAAAVRSTAHDGTPRRASVDGANEYLRAMSSDTDDSASSGEPPGVGACGPRASPRPRCAVNYYSPARHDAVGTRSDRFAYPARPAVASPSPARKRSLFNGLLSSPFSRLSLVKQHPAPSKPQVGSSFRMTTTESPSRPRRSTELVTGGKHLQSKAAPACCLAGEMKAKTPAAGPNKSEEEHQLRLLYTRHLQWRHANARAAAVLSSQRANAEKTLYSAWIAVLRMRKSVAISKLQLQLLRNNYKLKAILRGQMIYLEEWSLLERVYANSLSGTTRALNATVVRLPVSNGAMADIRALKSAIGSAMEVMQNVANSTSTQLSKLARANVLVSQLSRVVAQELLLMSRCRELLSTLASMQVKHCSLQGQKMQLNQRRLRRFQ